MFATVRYVKDYSKILTRKTYFYFKSQACKQGQFTGASNLDVFLNEAFLIEVHVFKEIHFGIACKQDILWCECCATEKGLQFRFCCLEIFE